MQASTAWLGTRWPDPVLEQLQALSAREDFRVEQAHLRGYFEWQSLQAMPWSARLAFVLRKLVPEPGYMRARYRLTHARQLPGAYLRRWATGLTILRRYLGPRR
jgi:hypothetical protein